MRGLLHSLVRPFDMTWYADEIILCASDKALAEVVGCWQLSPFAYHIRSLAGHEWYRSEQQHGLPEGGLLVLRPVCGNSSYGLEWHGTSILDWVTLPFDSLTESLLDDSVTQRLGEYLDEESAPPLRFRQAVATLARRLDQPVLYYGCGMWGGEIDYEYCLTYRPAESLVATQPSLPPDRPGVEDALRVGLANLGLNLPTAYFAPHTRGFPWEAHRLG